MGEVRQSRWYFGGIACGGAACITHPLDLLKVHMQTQKGKNINIFNVGKKVVRDEGVIGLYNGISASLLRQFTYSMARFGIYESAKQHWLAKNGTGQPMPFYVSATLAGLGGVAGGLVGNPADLVNVRMQNDMKVPPAQRRNYRNAIHGLYSVLKTEGVMQLWAGFAMNCSRSVLMTIGQLSFYDQVKGLLLKTSYFGDDVNTHILSSFVAGAIATSLTQPFDVLKTRSMNAKKGEITGVMSLFLSTAKEGPLAFFKGYVPAFVRIAPHTIITFVFLEQLRLNFGFVKVKTEPMTC